MPTLYTVFFDTQSTFATYTVQKTCARHFQANNYINYHNLTKRKQNRQVLKYKRANQEQGKQFGDYTHDNSQCISNSRNSMTH